MTRARHPRATPSERLAIELTRLGVHGMSGYCAKARVSLDDLFRAAAGKQIGVNAFLRLCAALQYDPLPEIPCPMIEPGDFQPLQFAMAFHIKQGLRGHDDTETGRTIGCTPRTVRRIKWAGPLSISLVIRACRYMAAHPFSYVNPMKILVKSAA